jgi:hypothetical protein
MLIAIATNRVSAQTNRPEPNGSLRESANHAWLLWASS